MMHVGEVQHPQYVAPAKDKVGEALKALKEALKGLEKDQEARHEHDGAVELLNQTLYYLQAANDLLQGEKCFEELEGVVMFLALSTRYMQGEDLSKVKNPLRDAMMLIAVSLVAPKPVLSVPYPRFAKLRFKTRVLVSEM